MSKAVSMRHSPNGCPGDPFVCPLSRVVAGTAVKIKRLGAPAEINRRLREMGLCEDRQIKLVSRQSNFICLVCNTRLGISSELADSIIVQPVSAKKHGG